MLSLVPGIPLYNVDAHFNPRTLQSNTTRGDGPSQLRKRKLINKTQRQTSVLQHVREAQVLELVLGGVDLLVGVLEVGLDDKGRGIARL